MGVDYVWAKRSCLLRHADRSLQVLAHRRRLPHGDWEHLEAVTLQLDPAFIMRADDSNVMPACCKLGTQS